MNHGARPFLSCGLVADLMEILGLLEMLRRAAAPVAAKAEELVLECLLCLTSASSVAAGQLYDRDRFHCGLKVGVAALSRAILIFRSGTPIQVMTIAPLDMSHVT